MLVATRPSWRLSTVDCQLPIANSNQQFAINNRQCSFLIELLAGRPNSLVDVGSIDRIAISAQSPVERRDGVVEPSQLEQHFAIVLLDDGVGLELIGGAVKVVLGEIQLVGLEICPTKAVEIGAVLRLDLQRF